MTSIYLDSVYFRVFCFGVHDLVVDFSSAVSIYSGFFCISVHFVYVEINVHTSLYIIVKVGKTVCI